MTLPAVLPDSFVIDCSIVAGAFLRDEQSPLSAEVRERCGELMLIAPRVLRLEFLNVALIARRRGRIDDEHFAALLSHGAEFPVVYDDGDSTLLEFGRNALALGLSSYDYAYLDCARRRKLPLATLDGALVRACAKVGVPVLTDARIAEAPAPYAVPPAAKAARARRAAPGRSRAS